MQTGRSPFWFRRLDRPKAAIGAALAVAALLLAVRVGPPPQVVTPTIQPPALASLAAGAPFTLAGTAAPGATVQVYDGDTLLGAATAGPDGAWQFPVPSLPAGDHSLTAKTTAADGTPSTSAPVAFTLPEAGPSPAAKLPAITPPDPAALAAGAPFTLAGTAAPGATVQVYDGDTLLGAATAGPDGAWQFPVPSLPAGDHSLTARTTAADGTPSTSQPVVFTLPEAAAVACSQAAGDHAARPGCAGGRRAVHAGRHGRARRDSPGLRRRHPARCSHRGAGRRVAVPRAQPARRRPQPDRQDNRRGRHARLAAAAAGSRAVPAAKLPAITPPDPAALAAGARSRWPARPRPAR